MEQNGGTISSSLSSSARNVQINNNSTRKRKASYCYAWKTPSILQNVVQDHLNDAIILLDPTLSSGTLKMTLLYTPIYQVVQAYRLLVKTCNICNNLFHQGSMTSSNMNEDVNDDDDDDEETTQESIHTTISILSDLYRALIISCYILLLKSVGVDNYCNRIDDGGQTVPISSLCQTIQKCIILLQGLSLIVQQSILVFYPFSKMHSINAATDWHDFYLPPSTHGLLLDCFMRKQRLCLEDDVIFGWDDRLIPLEFTLYHSDGDNLSTSSSFLLSMQEKRTAILAEDWEQYNFVPYATSSNEHAHNNFSSATQDNVFSSIDTDPQILLHEENILLDIAFPHSLIESLSKPNMRTRATTTTGNSVTHRKTIETYDSFSYTSMIHSRKRKRHEYVSVLSDSTSLYTFHFVRDIAKTFDLGPYLWNQHIFGPICVRKKGWIRIQTDKKEDSAMVQQDAGSSPNRFFGQVYASGLILLLDRASCNHDKSPSYIDIIFHRAYCINENTKVHLQIESGCIFFRLENIEEWILSRDKERVLDTNNNSFCFSIEPNEDGGDVLSQAYLWNETMSQMINFSASKKMYSENLRAVFGT